MRMLARLALMIGIMAAAHLPTRAMGFGAAAEAQGERGGRTLGWLLNARSQAEAEMTAVKRCEARKQEFGVHAPCRIVATFSEKCLAVADVGKWIGQYGWGVDADARVAEQEALALCRERAGPDNASSCRAARLWNTVCDKAPTPDLTPVVRTAAAVAVTGAIGVLIWNLAGGATIPVLNIIAGILGLVGMLYLVVSFTGGEDSGGAIAQNEVQQSLNTARRATYVSIAVAIASAVTVMLTLRWAWSRVHAVQVAKDRMMAGASRIFVSRSPVSGRTNRTRYGPTTGQVRSTRSGIGGVRETRAGAMLLQPKDGTDPAVLDPRMLQHAGVVIGRHRSCNVVVRDKNVSARHARVFMDRDGTLRIEDLDSTNGTWCDGERVKTALLRSGSRLRLGRTEYTVRIGSLR